MLDLSHYLQKFKVLIGDKTSEKRRVKDIVFDICAITVPLENISLKEGSLRLSLNPIERTELQFKRKILLEECSKQGLFITSLN